jgi:hypothetical protein
LCPPREPFDSEAGKRKPIDEVLRQLREEDPPSPSTKISKEKETATAVAERRGIEAKLLVKLLHGDLDWITVKAVAKDRTRRYGTPSELSADIRRYLENKPVLARPASTGYRLKKYVQRHRLGVAGATATTLSCSDCPAFHRLQTSRFSIAESPNRCPGFMPTPPLHSRLTSDGVASTCRMHRVYQALAVGPSS